MGNSRTVYTGCTRTKGCNIYEVKKKKNCIGNKGLTILIQSKLQRVSHQAETGFSFITETVMKII